MVEAGDNGPVPLSPAAAENKVKVFFNEESDYIREDIRRNKRT